ncbi:response regulator [Micromonospora zamorensis]|uniref:response regulator n=1 Tax=Micromonospora zamorensis TaxID=709883 RepID=UPI00081FB002|nr:response regulator transcription factor [Micromonospora zamorensis]SCG56209.1 DNA-binding response regulator, NarL/FixJ family, contains REC and HTH domains [Micromonospora zamorensis]
MRIVLAEDSTLLREGLARLLADEGHAVVAAVADADQLVTAVEQHRPDVVVTDVRMPPTNTDDGLRAALEIRRRWPDIAVLVLSQYVEKRYAAKLLADRSEGVGYVLKDRVAQVEDFLDALDRVAAGATALDPEVVRQLMSATRHSDPLNRLTPREREVLHHMAQGHTNATIAERLHVSQSAVEKHVNTIFDKLGLLHVTGYSRRVLAILRYLGS